MKPTILTPDAYLRAVTLRDLTDPAGGPHAIQRLVNAIRTALTDLWGCEARVHRAHPVVPLEHNYDRLHYPPDGAARDARYTRYVSETAVLRTQTSAMIPALLREVAMDPPEDVVLICPGLVYRRDQIDRLHTGEPHQVDVWRIARWRLRVSDLHEMVDTVLGAVLPGAEHRLNPSPHPYTVAGVEIEVRAGGEWVEVGECGLALPAILDEAGIPSREWSGLAMGLGLDRLLMLAKGIDDIRILRSADPRVAGQMLDLEPYRPVSSQPPVRRDLSVAVEASRTPEELGDRVRQALGDGVESLESVEVLAETGYAEVPPPARERIGMRPGQKNVLVRIVIRDLVRTLTSQEANRLRDAVYASLHEGSAWQWADASSAMEPQLERIAFGSGVHRASVAPSPCA
jgi:phenylalanyl-tRNA synthetase alpha chain